MRRVSLIQLPGQRHDLLVPDIFSDWANLLEPNDTGFVDQKTLGRPVDSIVNRRASLSVIDNLGIRITQFTEKLLCGDALIGTVVRVFVVHTVNGNDVLL